MAEGREPDGKFKAGNRIWEARSTCGPNPKFAGPEELWAACVEYFDWNEDNPLYEAKLTSYQGENKIEPLPKLRAMTIGGLCIFIGISQRLWSEWRSSRPDLLPVMHEAEELIRRQKFEGAAADLFNPNIIARDLGLADKSELTGKDGGPIETKSENVTDLELARRVAFLLTSGAKGMKDG